MVLGRTTGWDRWRRARGVLAAVVAVFTITGHAYALQPDEILKDPELERRARALSLELRCLVCQNQSIDDSDAPLARDLRVLVRERLVAGDSDAQVREFIVARYGDFVLLRPPFDGRTLLLWLTPLFVLVLAVVLARRTFSQPVSISGAVDELSEEERRRLDEVLRSPQPGQSGKM